MQSNSTSRGSKIPRGVHDIGESITVRRSARPTNNPLANRRIQEVPHRPNPQERSATTNNAMTKTQL